MNRADYIRQVDAMALPDGLYAKLSSLPSRKETRHAKKAVPYKRWAAIAAALVLVVGLGVAAPTILHALTPPGGDITNPPPLATSPSVSDPWGLRLYAEDVTPTGLTLVFEQSGGTAAGKLMTGPVFWVERYEDGQWTLLNTGTRNWTTEAYLISREDLTEFSEDWTSIYGALPSGRYRLGKNVMNSRGPGDYDEQSYYAEFTIESAPAPSLSDDELTELLAAEFPLQKTPQDTWELLGSSVSPEGRTLGVLQYEWEGSDGTPDSSEKWSNLLLGVYDNATRELIAPAVRVNGQYTYALPYSTGSGGQDYYVLCVGKNFGQGVAEYYSVALYSFDGRELRQVTTSPNAIFPPGTEDMFDSEKNEDFWNSSHQIVLAPGGFELFERNEDWYLPDQEGVSPWRYMGYVPLADKHPAPAALEGARRFYEDYYTGSSYYSFQLCELVPDYEDVDYPNAQAYHVVLDVGQDAVMDRYFLFDEEGTLLGTRSIPEGSLTIDGVNYALGIHTRNIFGTPVKTNLVPSTGNKSYYSEWFSPNANACGYTYYPATGEYRLSGISTIREDAYTARGIHVGSTVAEVIAAYPEANKEFSAQANYLSYYGPGFTIEFYFSTSLSREEMLKQTVTSINLSAEFW